MRAAPPINMNRPFSWRHWSGAWIWSKIYLVPTDPFTLISSYSTGSQSEVLLRNSCRSARYGPYMTLPPPSLAYQNDVEHSSWMRIETACSYGPIFRSSLKVLSEMVFRDVCGRVRDSVYDIARTVRLVLTAQQAAPAARPLSVRTEDQICSIDLASGEA